LEGIMPKMTDPPKPKLSVELTPERARRLRNCMTWGLQGKVFNIIVDDVIKMVEKYGDDFISAVLSHDITLEHYTSIKPGEDDGNNS